MVNASDVYIMQGASGGADGKRGIVPKPVAGDNAKVLKGDATFGSIVAANVTAGTLTTTETASGSKTGTATKFATGTAGTASNLSSWNGSGDIVDSGLTITQATAGSLAKVSEATAMGSDSTVTATSATASGLAIAYTPVLSTNDRYVEGVIDWSVYDATYGTTDNKAEAYALLEYSTNGSSWSTLQTYRKTAQVSDGKKLVGSSEDGIPAQISTTSTTYADTGLQVDYTAINGSNDRYIEVGLNCNVNRNASVSEATAQVQYFNGSSWVGLFDEQLHVSVGGAGATSTRSRGTLYRRYLHQVADDTPQYKVQYKVDNGSSSETFTIYPDRAYLRVQEMATDVIDANRSPFAFSYRHNSADATPFYRISSYVSAGDTSVIYAGSTLRVREVRAV